MRLKGQVALVTGSGGLMGRAIAQRFAEEGARVIINDISGNRLRETADLLENMGAEFVAVRGNATVRSEIEPVVQAGLDRFGQIDILINVVGGVRGQEMAKPLLEMDEARWDHTMALNLKGGLHCLQLVAPGMKERGHGRIVNISSVEFAGERNKGDYAAAKAAVVSLTRTAALELAPEITVNCIAPGVIKTMVMERVSPEFMEEYRKRIVLGWFGEPRDIANAALFLSSDEARYITGQVLAVSGGIWPAL